jgi:small subunit ribosomal protein S4
MKRKQKSYSRPKRAFEGARIKEEGELINRFGLKNKREIWKAQAKIDSIREKAKKLISADTEEQQAFFGRLKKIGLNVDSISDVLSLTKEDYLKRRLQTVLYEKKLVPTVKTARQFITHKRVLVGDGIVNSPSYIVPVKLEDKISIKAKKKKPAPEVKEEPVAKAEAQPAEENSELKKQELNEESEESGSKE